MSSFKIVFKVFLFLFFIFRHDLFSCIFLLEDSLCPAGLKKYLTEDAGDTIAKYYFWFRRELNCLLALLLGKSVQSPNHAIAQLCRLGNSETSAGKIKAKVMKV